MYAWRLRPSSICLGGGSIPVPVPIGIAFFLVVLLVLEGAQVVQGDGLGVLDLRVDLVDHLVVAAAAAGRQGKHNGGCVWMSEKGTALTNRSHTAVMKKHIMHTSRARE